MMISQIIHSLFSQLWFVRWSALRATEGWASLQYHSVLRTSITIFPPLEIGRSMQGSPRLHVRLVQGSFFCVFPTMASGDVQSEPLVPKWHSGNIYNLEQAPPQIIDLPAPPSIVAPTTYDIFVSGDYEVTCADILSAHVCALTLHRYDYLEIHGLIQIPIHQF